MSFGRQLTWTLLLQGGGSVAVIAAMALIGHALGPSAQGQFNRIKAEVEFIGALAMFGLPQSMFYFVQSGKLTLRRAQGVSLAAAGISALVAGIYRGWLGGLPTISGVLFGLAAAAFVWHGCMRGVVLATASTRRFNLMTALPQVLLLMYAAVAVALGRVDSADVSMAFVMAFALSSAMALRGNSDKRPDSPDDVSISRVLRYGFAAGVASTGATGATLLLIRAVEERVGASGVGVFTFALAIVQGSLLPLNYTLPLLFKRWMERPERVDALRVGVAAAALLCLVALLVWAVKGSAHQLGSYAPVVEVLSILMLAGSADACQRILAVDANARGAPHVAAMSELVRVGILAVALFLLPWNSLSDVAWIAVAAAIAGALMLVLQHRQLVQRVA